jgi:hypothetical protein
MIKSRGDNYRIYGLIIVKTTKKALVLNYGLSNATFETPNHTFALGQLSHEFLKSHMYDMKFNQS